MQRKLAKSDIWKSRNWLDKATTAKKSQNYNTLQQTDFEHVKRTFTVRKHQIPNAHKTQNKKDIIQKRIVLQQILQNKDIRGYHFTKLQQGSVYRCWKAKLHVHLQQGFFYDLARGVSTLDNENRSVCLNHEFEESPKPLNGGTV